MANKQRIGMRCYGNYVPNEIWFLYKRDLKKLLKILFPSQEFVVTEFYWQGYSMEDEYLRLKPKTDQLVDWLRVFRLIDTLASKFGMSMDKGYKEYYEKHANDPEEEKFRNYILESNRTWTETDLDEFLTKHSFENIANEYKNWVHGSGC